MLIVVHMFEKLAAQIADPTPSVLVCLLGGVVSMICTVVVIFTFHADGLDRQ